MYGWALMRREAVLGSEDTSTLGTAYGLCIVYRDQGRPAEAEAMFKRVLARKGEDTGPRSDIDT
jgi:hypothetical protein